MKVAALLLIWNLAWAGCRDHVATSADVPECPPNTSILNEGYPAKATFVSDHQADSQFVEDYVQTALEVGGSKPPQVFILTSAARFEALKAKILAKANIAQRKIWESSMSMVPGQEFPWMQDLLQGQIDPITGSPRLSGIQPMERLFKSDASAVRTTSRAILNAATKECGIQSGPPLQDPSFGKDFSDPWQNPSGFGGGNLEGGPAGICIVGRDHIAIDTHDKYAQQACGKAPVLKAPTSWLHVGHADEIGMTVRHGPGECDEAYLIYSPRAGMNVLRANPNELAFPELKDAGSSSWIGFRIGYDECFAFFDLKAGVLENTEPPKSSTQYLDPWILRSAHAEYKSKSRSGGMSNDELIECAHMTNLQLAQIYQSMYGKFMDGVQKELDEFANQLKTKWSEIKPNCEPKVLEVPMLYQGRTWETGDDGKRKITRGFPIFLPALNGTQLGHTLLMPETKNEAFRRDLMAKLEALNLQARFYDTSASNFNGGNLHCLTNTVRYCRPRGSGK